MSKTSELDYVVDSLYEELNAYIDHKISWAINGTKIEELENDDFNDAITEIKYYLITRLKHTL